MMNQCADTDCSLPPRACRSLDCKIVQCVCGAPVTEDDSSLCDLCDRLVPDTGFVSGATLAVWSRDLAEWAADSDFEYLEGGVFRDEHGDLWDAAHLYDYMWEVRYGSG